MSDLAKEFRAQLQRAPRCACRRSDRAARQRWHLQVVAAADSSQAFEMVYIPETDRGTLCISSQVGCALDCSFCATAQQGFNRNLSTAEIVGQVWLANRELGFRRRKAHHHQRRADGHGRAARQLPQRGPGADILLDDLGFDLSRRRVTLSTSGLVPQIYKLGA
jgi:23S rRNA (adenine2503-C2)-methyltransferase